MKVCKKCKKHVANKVKICKYCGADVSKAKIIKNNSKTNPKINVKNDSLKSKNVNNDVNKKVDVIKSSVTKKNTQNKENVCVDKKERQSNLSSKSKSLEVNEFSDNKKNKIKNEANTSKLKNLLLFKNKVKSLFMRNRKNVKDKTTKIKFSARLKLLRNKIKVFFVNFGEYIVSRKIFNTKLNYKNLSIVAICLFILGFGIYFGVDIYINLTNAENKVVVGEKATTEKIFGMGDLITYNGIDYKILKVETSEGNSYKAPEEGNQFLIVTIYMKNNTGEKFSYSYKNWTMSNSLGKEEKRIFTSVNVDTALYSGDLVIGGIKTGSMVFEQPINDPKLRMNFYELKKDKDGEEVIDTTKKVFSVSVKVPEEISPESSSEDGDVSDAQKKDVSKVEVINTSDEKSNKRT